MSPTPQLLLYSTPMHAIDWLALYGELHGHVRPAHSIPPASTTYSDSFRHIQTNGRTSIMIPFLSFFSFPLSSFLFSPRRQLTSALRDPSVLRAASVRLFGALQLPHLILLKIFVFLSFFFFIKLFSCPPLSLHLFLFVCSWLLLLLYILSCRPSSCLSESDCLDMRPLH